MITKFRDLDDSDKIIEFVNAGQTLRVYVSDFEPNQSESRSIDLTLSKDNLFDLIGQLLRIQSEIKKEG